MYTIRSKLQRFQTFVNNTFGNSQVKKSTIESTNREDGTLQNSGGPLLPKRRLARPNKRITRNKVGICLNNIYIYLLSHCFMQLI